MRLLRKSLLLAVFNWWMATTGCVAADALGAVASTPAPVTAAAATPTATLRQRRTDLLLTSVS
jgi:hypothetical protein